MNIEFIVATTALTLLAVVLVVWPVWQSRAGGGLTSVVASFSMLLGIPVAAVLIYITVNTYPWDSVSPVGATARAQPDQEIAPPVSEMVSALAERMRAEPTVEGLEMLGRSYVSLQRYDEAVDAWHRAWELSQGAAPAISLGYAEALILADRRTLATSAGDLVDDALLQLPDDPRALWYGGLSAAERGDEALAMTRWTKLLNSPDLPDNLRTVLQQQMAALSGEPLPAAPVEAPAAATDSRRITATIALSPALQAQGGEGGIVYLIAREAGAQGPPVGARRIFTSEFPLTVELTDADVMLPGRSLADIRKLEMTARLSRSGNAIAAAGDLYGTVTSGGGDSVNILIDSVQE